MIELSDGLPYHGGLVAVIDESAPIAGSGVFYILTTAVLIDPAHATAAVASVLGQRQNPFHWSREGVTARQRMVDTIGDLGTVGAARWRPVARTGQVSARRALLTSHLLAMSAEGASHLIIESGDAATNLRDAKTILDTFKPTGGVPFHYDWRSKAEPLLWIADAISGAASDYLANRNDRWWRQLDAHGLDLVNE